MLSVSTFMSVLRKPAHNTFLPTPPTTCLLTDTCPAYCIPGVSIYPLFVGSNFHSPAPPGPQLTPRLMCQPQVKSSGYINWKPPVVPRDEPEEAPPVFKTIKSSDAIKPLEQLPPPPPSRCIHAYRKRGRNGRVGVGKWTRVHTTACCEYASCVVHYDSALCNVVPCCVAYMPAVLYFACTALDVCVKHVGASIHTWLPCTTKSVTAAAGSSGYGTLSPEKAPRKSREEVPIWKPNNGKSAGKSCCPEVMLKSSMPREAECMSDPQLTAACKCYAPIRRTRLLPLGYRVLF